MTEPDPLYEALASKVGLPIGRGVSVAPDPVNQPMIRHWTAAFSDHDPVYVDPEIAARSRFGQVVAPPFMLQTWTMPTPVLEGIRERGGSPVASDGPGPLAVLDEAGFTATLATNSEYEIERYVHLGEVVSARTVLESVSERKRTRLGPGYFITWLTTYSVGDEVVGRQRFRIMKFAPEGAR
jgi:acyl dehydratase